MKTSEELKSIFKTIVVSVQEKAKQSEAPIFYFENGKRIRQEPNGDRFVQIIDSNGEKVDYKI
ncbi:hypothetical protein Q5741_13885 [Paenibacillus sp. JX-17]|uniref:Uncharacterized protein n=1 Tax=Paenibacillus lacisoli TaxID=3064525 RepID=A0ABT9CHU2_9BACL|nr:hypothetical protein [Paenibacillus sp. JX-17]MDO7907497.1 hypothetical protein [Paenibacillus sp. JX-17]